MAASPVPPFELVTYVRATPEQVWRALTDEGQTARFWRHRNRSDWRAGSTWEHLTLDEPARAEVRGRVLEARTNTLLRFTFESPEQPPLAEAPFVTITLEQGRGITRLRLVHAGLPDDAARATAAHGWSAVIANLKTLLETGEPLPQDPWEMAP